MYKYLLKRKRKSCFVQETSLIFAILVLASLDVQEMNQSPFFLDSTYKSGLIMKILLYRLHNAGVNMENPPCPFASLYQLPYPPRVKIDRWRGLFYNELAKHKL